MARTITVNGSNITSSVRLDFNFSEHAFRGRVGAGNLTVDDPDGTLWIAAQKTFTVVESAATPDRVFTGFVAERAIRHADSLNIGEARQWDVTVEDLNTFLDDNIAFAGASPDRPEENDRERVRGWMLLGTGMLPGTSVGNIPNTNLVDMDAIDYTGEVARAVLEDAGQKSGKNYFLYDWGAGYRLFYAQLDEADNAVIDISDDPADIDNVTVFGPSAVTVRMDPARIYSTIRLKYDGGAASDTLASTVTRFRQREKNVINERIKTATKADQQVDKLLDKLDSEVLSVSLSVHVPAANVNDIRAGQRVLVKLRTIGGTAIRYFVTQRDVRARSGPGGYSDVEYTLALTFADRIMPTKLYQAQSGG